MNYCPYCFEDTPQTKDPHWGWICCDCRLEMNRIEQETDWDTWEADKRQRIAESNEH